MQQEKATLKPEMGYSSHGSSFNWNLGKNLKDENSVYSVISIRSFENEGLIPPYLWSFQKRRDQTKALVVYSGVTPTSGAHQKKIAFFPWSEPSKEPGIMEWCAFLSSLI